MADDEQTGGGFFKDYLSGHADRIFAQAFPQLSPMLKAFESHLESQKAATKATENATSNSEKNSSKYTDVLVEAIQDSMDIVHNDLKMTNIILSSSLTEQTRMAKALDKIASGGGGVGMGIGGGNFNGSGGGSGIGDAVGLAGIATFATFVVGAALKGFNDLMPQPSIEKQNADDKEWLDAKRPGSNQTVGQWQDANAKAVGDFFDNIFAHPRLTSQIDPTSSDIDAAYKRQNRDSENRRADPERAHAQAYEQLTLLGKINTNLEKLNDTAEEAKDATKLSAVTGEKSAVTLAAGGAVSSSTASVAAAAQVPIAGGNGFISNAAGGAFPLPPMMQADAARRARGFAGATPNGTFPAIHAGGRSGQTVASGSTVTGTQNSAQNKQFFLDALNKGDIQDPEERAAMAAVTEGESHFQPHSETDYSHTSNARIRSIFGSRVGDLSEEQLTQVKADPEQFFNKVYGGRLGNTQNEGYKYRGRGYFQLTGKANYEKYGKASGLDLVNNPDLANDPKNAARIAVEYMKDRLPHSSGGSTFERVAKAVGNLDATNPVINNAFHENMRSGEFAPGKQADLSSSNDPASKIMQGGGVEALAADDMQKLLGMQEVKDNPTLRKFLTDGGVQGPGGTAMDPHELAWCAGFVNAALGHEGIKGTNTDGRKDYLFANSFASWGKSVDPKDVAKGDVLEYKNGSHVGMSTGNTRMGKNGLEVEMISGNSRDHDATEAPGPNRSQVGKVSTNWMSVNDLNIRRAGEAELPPQNVPQSNAKGERGKQYYSNGYRDIGIQARARDMNNATNIQQRQNTLAAALHKSSAEEALTMRKSSLPPVVQQFNHKTDKSEGYVGDHGRHNKRDSGPVAPPDQRLDKLFTLTNKSNLI